VGGGVGGAGTAADTRDAGAAGAAATASGRALPVPQGLQAAHQPLPLKLSILLLTCCSTLLAAPPGGGTRPVVRTGLGPCGFKLAASVERARRTPYHQPPAWLPNWPLPVLLLLLEMMSATAVVAP
jgi:hypothetical protein